MIIYNIWKQLFWNLYLKIESDMMCVFICVLLTILAFPIDIILLPIELISWIVFKIIFREESEEKE